MDEQKFAFCVTCIGREDGLDCEDCEQGELYEPDPDLIVTDDEGRMGINKMLLAA